ncbi:hypothetical protein H072_5366 [Dactylellina haptotyla CBS 200.50]|uniref:HTH La-type RNA-binding domain-containing protein n=1 Tax=Dactylellina haptotyla (strain CBS 200.50) TaxID=1284197 RepID=S8ACT7_DACHA|nr:hypothetical protein H072_5366 [Dactylellina haptotyla CBS 200.50]
MTTATATETKKPAFSYAAAASGKAKPSNSGVSTPEEPKKQVEDGSAPDSKMDKDTLDISKLNINGEPSAAPKDQSSGPSPQVNGTTSDTKSSSSVKGTDTQSNLEESSNKEEDDGRSTTSGQEGTGSATGNEDGDSKSGKEVGPDGKTKFKTHNLVDAPIPKQNPWTVRKEAMDRTRQLQVDTKKPQPTVNGTPSQDKGSQTYGNDRRHSRQRSTASENRPPHHAAGGRRDGFSGLEKRGAPDAGKEGKVLTPIEDASRASRPTGRPTKGQQDELASRDVSTPPAPPSLTDKSLWPTPEVAQDEEKREKREKEEKEKEREKPTLSGVRQAKDKWISMPVTPNIIYDTPLPTRGPRGPRGGRPERGGRVGQPPSRPAADTDTSTTPTEPTSTASFDKARSTQAPSEQKGAQNTNSDVRARRPTNATAPTAENASAELAAKKDVAEVQKTGPAPLANGAPKPNGVSAGDSSNKERKPTQTQDDGAFVGQGILPPAAVRAKADKPTPFSSNRDQPSNQGRGGYAGPFNQKQEGDVNNTTHGVTRDRPAGRGNFRGGRGDSNSFMNHANSRYNNGNSVRHHSPPSQINTNPHQPRQSPQYPSSPSTPQTGRSYRQNSRGHGVQQSQQFGKYGMQNGYPPQSPFVQSPSYYNNPYYNARNGVNPGVPMHPDYEFTAAVQNVMNQLSYYFSLDNMVKDTYLRSHMDSQGWVFLDVICGFRKIKEMTKENKNIVREASIQSPDVEFRGYHPDGRERLRSARNPTEWVLKYEERDESCRHDGPIWETRYTGPPQYMNGPYPMYFQNPNMPPMPVAGPTDQHFPGYNGYPQPAHMMPAFVPGQEFVPENGAAYGNGFMPPYQPFMSGHEAQPTNGHPVEEGAPQNDKGIRPHKKYPTVDEFSDDKINQIVLVIRKNPNEKGSEQKEGPQTTSVMVTDQLNEALVKLEQSNEVGTESQKSKDNEDHLVKFYPTSPRLGPAMPVSQKLNDEVGWFVDLGVSSESGRTPEVTAFKLYAYTEFKNRVLGRRGKDGVADVPEIDILYRFFSHFLRKHFNLNMYNEFKSLALEDFHNGSMSGVEYLYKFHVFKIQNFPTPDLFFQDFATLSSEQHHERPPYDKKMVDAVGYSKTITGSTKTRLGRFMQEKNKNFQMWPVNTNHHHHHHHHGGNHNHNNHGHQNSNHGPNGPSVRG